MGERVEFSVNGKQRALEVRAEESAVEILRDRLGLTGTKLVCGDGVCGACTVLLDGVPVVSCLLPAGALQHREVTTVEGFGPELHPVQRAFIANDALQCGYCTPGFVVEAIAFHDRWRRAHGSQEPTRDDVVEALAGHLCRCGAYVGVIAAVRDACAGRFDSGEATGPRLEAPEKVTGRAVYAADVRHEGQLEGAILRSPHPHARVLSVDLDAARALPGVAAAVELLGKERIVRYVGQEVAAVAATDPQAVAEALARVRVEYEPLPAAIGAAAARREGAPAVYSGLRKKAPTSGEGPLAFARWHGNVRGPAAAFSQRARKARRLIAEARERADPLLVEGRWRTAQQVHTAFEPHACVARWEGETLHVHLSTQAAVRLAEQIAKRFDLAVEQVQLIAEHVGGGFGAKQKLTPEAIAAVELARAAAAPVRVVLDRGEEMSVAGHRPGAEIELALLPSASEGPRAVQMHVYGDGGVSAGSGIAIFGRMVYPAPAKDLQDYDVVNNMPPGVPFRGPGAPVACWALEQAVDEAAHRLGEDPVALRRRWDPHAGRQRLYRWAESLALWRERPPTGSQQGRFRRGVGIAAAIWLYIYQLGCQVEVGVESGRLFVGTGSQDIGTGSRSVLAGTVARAFDVEPSEVDVRIGRSWLARGPGSGGSSATATLVPATLAAVADLQRRLIADNPAAGSAGDPDWAAILRSAPDVTVRGDRPEDGARPPGVGRPLEGSGPAGWVTGKILRWSSKLGMGSGYTGAVHVSEVEVDTWLGRTRVLRAAAGIGAGRLAAPELARSQCYGGVIQGVGYALFEQRQDDSQRGIVLSAGLEDYRIPGIGDTPEIDVHFDEEGFEHVPGGGVGLGEISTVAVAASIGNAVHNATGWRPYELPIRPDRLLDGLRR
jgi:CO/xanthine dehydrogenase Mo-binding subunit/aerobic-type carbon monoxide dehydrogenase small subunit (CoxS/CutS family)